MKAYCLSIRINEFLRVVASHRLVLLHVAIENHVNQKPRRNGVEPTMIWVFSGSGQESMITIIAKSFYIWLFGTIWGNLIDILIKKCGL